MGEQDVSEAVRSLPKAELHVHIEGTLEPGLALDLAKRNGVSLPWATIDELRRQYEFGDLQSFLDLYYQLMGTLASADDFHDLMLAYLAHAVADGVRHAEIFFDPQVHIRNGLDIDAVMDGLLSGLAEGRKRFGITGGLILSIVRDLPIESADSVLDAVQNRAGDLLGIGLDSAEVGYPPSLFVHVYDRAREMGLHCVAHAGEEGSSDYVAQALDLLHAERIDHGVHAIDDPALVARIARSGIALTACPLSNRRLQVVKDLHDLPLQEFLRAGVPVTVNSDDPAYFGGYIADNYAALEKIGFSLEQLGAIALNSIHASFISPEEMRDLEAQYASWKARYLN
ncbi:MAG: adenosine deaminase [Bifidobacterium sp.]